MEKLDIDDPTKRSCMKKILFALLCSSLLVACQPQHDQQTTLEQRVMTAGKIRCGYFDWDPLLKKDVNTGKFSGIAQDVMDELTTRLGIKYEWSEEVGPSTAVESIKSKRVDMICLPIIITNPRMRVADFSDPILFSRFSVWMRNDATVTDTAQLNDAHSKFVAIDGTAPMAMTKRLFPKAQIVSLTELSPTADMFLSVTGKKADAVFSDTSNAGMFSRYNPGQIKPVSDPDTDRVLPWAFMTPQNEYDFTRMIDLALRDMQLDGTIDKIVKKHQAETMYLPAAMLYRNNN
jgi:ABC-type amino acid transport substrate-binding protein